ncbi:unnamed protein product [Linum tenue]|uniref:La-related protein 6C n=1 Tax=Linum tenue TaxID=586396 RepID=A0AAV0MJR1_9ROSI|nr:unnamed protein product [Linum tenue]
MAQAHPEKKIIDQETSSSSLQSTVSNNNKEMMITAMMKENAKPPPTTPSAGSDATGCSSASAAAASFKFNAQAPEFVPRSHSTGVAAIAAATAAAAAQQMSPISGYFYPCFHYLGAAGGSDWFFLGDQDASSAAAAAYLISNPNLALPNCSNKDSPQVLTEELRQKIVKQAEYQFSDMSLLANESMSKHLSKDPEGYVPISVIASTKKMKSLTSNHHLITQALKSSPKLVVHEDARRVKRKIPFTEKEREELQSRTVVVENLPEDHSHQNLEKIFGVVGSVKTIRICHPQESNSSRSKSDFFMSNKLHALVEFDTPDVAEKAAEKLNDERNWRKGLRVRLLLRCSPKSVLKSRKSEFEGILDDEEGPFSDSLDDISIPNTADLTSESNLSLILIQLDENSGSSKKAGCGRGRGKGRGGRLQSHGSGRGLLSPSPQAIMSSSSSSSSAFDAALSVKHNATKGPRMPDGTRGFTMGRGKPLMVASPAAAMVE